MVSWCKKYAPKKYSELVLPEDPPGVPIQSLLSKLCSGGECLYPGIILYGKGGSGKTAFANYLQSSYNWSNVYYVSDTGALKAEIDALYELAEHFSHQAFKGKVLIVANELSKSTKDFRDGLRGLLDNHSETLFLIATDNDIEKLRSENPQLIGHRRILEIDWDLIPSARVIQRCAEILKAEGCFSNETYERLVVLAKEASPDIGTILQLLQLQVESKRNTNEKND